jgi:hypothetical protein
LPYPNLVVTDDALAELEKWAQERETTPEALLAEAIGLVVVFSKAKQNGDSLLLEHKGHLKRIA